MELTEAKKLARLFATQFIARPEVKALQYLDGDNEPKYTPTRDRNSGAHLPFTMDDLVDHLMGNKTYGHYLMGLDDKVKLFAFDIDLKKSGWLPMTAPVERGDPWGDFQYFEDLRGEWHTRSQIARPFMKAQFQRAATELALAIQKDLGLRTAVAYSGNKGVHVYGFLDKRMDTIDAREGALIVLDSVGGWAPRTQSKIFYDHTDTDHVTGYPNLSIEVYPKQESIASKEFGNLLRLPLGRNLKHAADPTFFIDISCVNGKIFSPMDSVIALQCKNPFKWWEEDYE